MKIRTLSIFAAAAIVSLTACGGDEAAEDGMEGDTTATVVPAPLPAPTPMPADTGMAGMDTMTHDTMADTTKM